MVGDICDCSFSFRENATKEIFSENKVRITSIIHNISKETNEEWYSYNCYVIALDKYTELGVHWLTIDAKATRNNKLNAILDGK